MTKLLSRLSPYLLWLILSLPALGIFIEAFGAENSRIFHRLLHPTGEFSARFLIISLMATPLAMLLRGWRGPRWLVRNRRYFGIAAFGYALLHTVFYLMSTSMSRIISDLPDFYIWTGWVAFIIFLPLAATSFDAAVKRLGTKWKALQRWVYAAAILTLLHWASLHDWRSPGAALIHFAPLAALSLYRLWWLYLRPRKTQA
ncbi:MAG: ferric reductase-like transmembrane domain-containing protein [Rhodobacteraceae bacterium]|nr:ferric reductase-like transmembrane domain-containing protein [Paracoccaceae bacterium]